MPNTLVRRLLALLGIVLVLAALVVLTLLVVSYARDQIATNSPELTGISQPARPHHVLHA
jgi:hypothetical protein